MVLPLSKIALAVERMFPDSFYEEMRKYVETAVQSAMGKLNLVTHDKFEKQNKQLIQFREKIETLEALVTKPQQQTKNRS